ncbi:protein translocase subunit secA, partial [gut metagenome]
GIYLRSYAQNNPLQQYVQEGFDMFEDMNRRIDREIASYLLKVRIRQEKPQNKVEAARDAAEARKHGTVRA